MSVQESFNTKFLTPEISTRFENVHKKESEEVLDNLGYIKLNRNGDTYSTDEEIGNGIDQFRSEFRAFNLVFTDLLQLPESESSPLTEEELDFLHKISSLEGEYNLHHFTLDAIGENPILSRILNWRLCIISISCGDIEPFLNDNTRNQIDKLKTWCGLNTDEEMIDYLGDVDKLSHLLADQKTYVNSDYHHIVYFKSSEHRFFDLKLNLADELKWFEYRMELIPEEKSIDLFRQLKSDSKRIEALITDELNQLMTRLVQIKLWMFGTYSGSLDNDLGPLTISGLNSLITYVNENYSESKGANISNLLTYLKHDCWALNVTYLLNDFLPVVEKKGEPGDDEKLKIETISEEMGKLIAKFPDEKDKNQLLSVINEQIENDAKSSKKRKTKNRSSKGFLRSVGNFFNRIGNLISNGIKWVIDAIKKLFKWFTNCAKILLRELKKIFEMVNKAFAFFFSKREITTSSQGSEVYSKFDLNFDCITYVSGISDDLITQHILKNQEITMAMTEVSDFLGTVVSFAIKIALGPYGWIQLGIKIIGYLAKNKFSYNRLSFNYN